MTTVYVKYDQHCEVTRERDPEDQWDNNDLSYSTYVDCLTLSVDKHLWRPRFEQIEVCFDIKEEVPYYLLYVTYSTGDSFHLEYGHVEFVGLYKSEKVAKENAHRIQEHNEKYNLCDQGQWRRTPLTAEQKRMCKKFNKSRGALTLLFEIEGEQIKEHEIYAPWQGYFERLTSVNVQVVYLSNN